MTDINKSDFNFDSTGLQSGEKRWGTIRFNNYKERYHIDNISDLQLLSELVFREALQTRYKKQIEKLNKSETSSDNPKIPSTLLSTLDENLDKIISLKKEIGLLQEIKGDDPFKYVQQLKKKFKLWLEENQGSRTTKCPHCSKIIMFKIKTDKWEAGKHPFFKDNILTNKHLIEVYKKGKIDKEDVSKILGCSKFYIDWLIEKWYQNNDNPSD